MLRSRISFALTCAVALLVPSRPALAQSSTDLPVQVFVVAGQSNAVGSGSHAQDLPAAWRAPQRDVRFWFEVGPPGSATDASLRVSSGGKFVPLAPQSDPAGRTFGVEIEGFGPELALGRHLRATIASDVAIVKFGINGTDLAHDWSADRAGSLFDELVDEVARARAALTAAGRTSFVAGVFWMQGELDATNSDLAWTYQANLARWIERARTSFGDPALPFVLGRLNVHIDSGVVYSAPYLNVVRAAQVAVVAQSAASAFVDTDNLALGLDRMHFEAAGELGLGLRMAAEYLALRHRTPGVPFCVGDFGTNACPCNNAGPAGMRGGCRNSSGFAARLLSVGSARISADKLVLVTSGVAEHALSIYLQGQSRAAATPFGDGLRCFSGSIVRIATKVGNASYPSTNETPLSLKVPTPVGAKSYYQVVYRDAVPFCTFESMNTTNALEILWRP